MFGSVAVAMLGVVGDASALPDREWGTYYGGSSGESAPGVVFDSWGNLIVVGSTSSTAGIATSGGFDTVYNGSVDAFISQWDQAGSPVWGTYYGGSADDIFLDAVVNDDDEIYAVGYTKSTSGIARGSAHQTSLSGINDAMLVKFDNAGDPLWATYYGGPGVEVGNSGNDPAVCVGGDGSVFLVGSTTSTSQIATTGSHQPSKSGTTDAFIVKFSSAGVRSWATYYGGTDGHTIATGCAVDSAGNVLVGGETAATNGIAWGGHDNSFNGGASDGFVVKFNASGVRQWATYYGGSEADTISAVSLAPSDSLVIAGVSESTNFIATSGTHDWTHNGGKDGFIAKLNAAGMRQWGTFLGTAADDSFFDVDVSPSGVVYVVGQTSFPGLETIDAWDTTVLGWEGLFANFSDTGALLYSSYNGGNGAEALFGVAFHWSGIAAMVGQTTSIIDIATTGAFDTALAGMTDGFITLVRLWAV
ncbi:SBBP repeat-containing protein [Nannocystis sp. ncelm1]|uniref:SBBP repeat-containing protein n=2 Tax=Nannocystis radixulma TaxID=2995305 RepID=A0ABT5BAG6_9BACT|nr:SBBP repeat-containing protein [Nannocystis radixulma]